MVFLSRGEVIGGGLDGVFWGVALLCRAVVGGGVGGGGGGGLREGVGCRGGGCS